LFVVSLHIPLMSPAARLEEKAVSSGRTWMLIVELLELKMIASFIVPEVGRSR
jgi:hypothetical protein